MTVRSHHQNRSTERQLSDEEVSKILAYAAKANPEHYLIIWLMAKRGLRDGTIVSNHRNGSNLAGLQVEDLLEDRIWYDAKKGHRKYKFLPPDIVAKLRHGIGTRTQGPIFDDLAKQSSPIEAVRYFVHQYAKAVGIPDWQYIRPHAFRHYAGYRFAEVSGFNPYAVRDFMDHSNTSIGSRYVHELPPEKQRAIQEAMD